MSFLDHIPAILRIALTESRSYAAEADRAGLRPFLVELSPVLVVIFVGLGLGVLLSTLKGTGSFVIAKETGLIVALILAISSVWYNIPFYGCSAANRHFEPKTFRYVLHGDVDPYFQGHPRR